MELFSQNVLPILNLKNMKTNVRCQSYIILFNDEIPSSMRDLSCHKVEYWLGYKAIFLGYLACTEYA
jgi:hypothetical protein